jgi:tetratricopeptide (TPR) repeat protein
VLGESHPDYLSTLGNLAVSLNEQGRYADAEPLYRAAYEARAKVLGPEHPATLASANNLGANLNDQKRYGESEPLYRSTLEVRTPTARIARGTVEGGGRPSPRSRTHPLSAPALC